MGSRRSKIISVLGLVGVTLGLAAAAPALAAQSVPLSADISGTIQITRVGAMGPEAAHYSGEGIATHFGVVQLEGDIAVTGPASACEGGFAATHKDTLASADGSQVLLDITEQSCPRPGSPGTYDCTGTYTITGGTRRFAGVSGSGAWSGSVAFGPDGSGPFTTKHSGVIAGL